MSTLVQPAEMGSRVVRLLAGFEAGYRGTCDHKGADQWARAVDRWSACLECLGASSSTAEWERSGPCDLCGRLLPSPPPLTWAIPSKTGATVAVRLCDECAATEVLALEDEPETEGDEDA